jgi:hypothetical protein
MVLHEGCRRLRTAGKTLIFLGLATVVLGTVVLSIGYAVRSTAIENLAPIFLMAVFFTFATGAPIWFIGWVIEGFASPQAGESEGTRSTLTR